MSALAWLAVASPYGGEITTICQKTNSRPMAVQGILIYFVMPLQLVFTITYGQLAPKSCTPNHLTASILKSKKSPRNGTGLLHHKVFGETAHRCLTIAYRPQAQKWQIPSLGPRELSHPRSS